MFKVDLKLIIVTVFITITGCTSMNDAMTPSLNTHKDSFDGALIVSQAPVSSSSSLTEGWHTMGFEWNQKFPDVVFLEVGTNGITNVQGVAFNVDGEIIENITEASVLTKYGSWSTRRLVMPINEFVKVAKGRDVKMKLIQIDTYSVSTFGVSNSGAVVNSKFPPFLNKLKELNVIQ
ncbi:hypothetical protein EGC86_04090 [Shewanella frigidimarina]|uniref:hypothetical protein n=1 Tax=Shewanella frigidimarina TaxID=56812 RepID=UPI000F4D5982|nr:hypothetical protein [Shewanella frigidimarina]RPA64454.1 hypothetical protein EGC86_04090 [Shewanella frigidimarina]